MFGFKKKKLPYPYDPEKEKPAVKASICTGERAAGFVDRTSGAFHEVMLIRSDAELKAFCDLYGLTEIEKIY